MRGVTLALALLLLLLAAGCEQRMDRQPRLDTYEAAAGFEHRQAARRPPPGTVPRRAAPDPGGVRYTRAVLERGRERFAIFCAPCHGLVGDATGPVVARGFPAPPTYHQPRLRSAPDQHFFTVMSEGHGVMYPYADRIPPEDRWAIAGYIRALQLSQHVDVAAHREVLEHLPGGGDGG